MTKIENLPDLLLGSDARTYLVTNDSLLGGPCVQ